MQQNFMNTNEVFPILDLIGMAMNKRYGKPRFDYIGGGDADTGAAIPIQPNLRVTKLDITRDTTNPVMPTVSKVLDIEYENGATAKMTIHRGLTPPVPSDVTNSDFINYVMITGLTMVTTYGSQTETMEVKIRKEDGYKSIQGLDVTWDGELTEIINVGEPPIVDPDPDSDQTEFDPVEPNEDFDTDLDYDNPNDFFTGEAQGDETAI